MKTPSWLNPLYYSLLLLGACHSNPSTPPRPIVLPTASPQLVAHDSAKKAPDENYDTIDPATRSHFRDVQAFLDYIKRPDDDTNLGSDAWIKHFRIANVDSFLNFITVDSLEIDDADADPAPGSVKYPRTMLREQLTRRKGAAFDMIGVISLHYSIPYPQYSHTRFYVNKADSIPNLNVTFSDFVLYFRTEKGSAAYKLYRLESDQISDL